MPVGSDQFSQRLVRLSRAPDGTLLEQQLEAVAFLPLIGAEGWADRGGEGRLGRRSRSG